MPTLTARTPRTWEDLEDVVTAILCECGMDARRKERFAVPRGTITVDVYAEEEVSGIVQSLICECKHWGRRIPGAIVRDFRTVMQETGVHRGHLISKAGFQTGAVETAKSTNVDLLTFQEFQDLYFDKWIDKRLWSMEEEIGNFNTYYEPIGPPGYSRLSSEEEQKSYDRVWNEFLFAGLILQPFSPYIRMVGDYPIPSLPFDVSQMENRGVQVPDEIKTIVEYRELFELLQEYAREGLSELRKVNPITRGKRPEAIFRDD